jgi:ketosteroid isomerase-like protein
MKHVSFIFLLVLASVSFAHAQSEKDHRDEKVERELIALVRLWDGALVNRDVATLERLLADEFTLSGTPRATYLKYLKTSEDVIESAVSDNFDVRVYKDVALLIAVDTIKSRRKGVAVVERYRYIDVWVKRDGRWQCVATESQQLK